MPLSKAEMRERKRQDRLNVKPNSDSVIPKVIGVLEGVKPNSEGFYPAWAITSWRTFSGKVIKQPLPNCPDGRYRR